MNSAVLTLIFLVTIVNCSTIPLATLKPGCMHEGKFYPEGEFKPNPCSPCHCHQGQVACAIVDCFFTLCVDSVRDPDQCCPVCPNGPNCRAPNGQIIAAGQHVQIDENTTCSCPKNGGGMGFLSFNQALCAIKAEPVTAVMVN